MLAIHEPLDKILRVTDRTPEKVITFAPPIGVMHLRLQKSGTGCCENHICLPPELRETSNGAIGLPCRRAVISISCPDKPQNTAQVK
ncbi:MAG: hypothetical protein IJ083_16995 [Clostridia bacterium]|nr:hypothetical protein [Clostridia bacterium]